jgi:hypothetical protein
MSAQMTNEQAANAVSDVAESFITDTSTHKALRMAEAALRAQGWQPIETAPKKGRELILLLTASRFPQVAYSNTWWTCGFSAENKPTHWMPLPPDPHPQGEERGRYRSERRVVCAAIRAADGELLLGIRHYSRDMYHQLEHRIGARTFYNRHDPDQGFVDQYGQYMTREEAYAVALAAGQLRYPEACGQGLDGPKLYSEGLY